MITQLQANTPKKVITFKGVVTVYIKDFGAGNLRLATNRDDLIQTATAPGGALDGIPQNAASGLQQYFWSGDLWMISDQNDAIMWYAPAYQLYQGNRLQHAMTLPADIDVPALEEGNLSTY